MCPNPPVQQLGTQYCPEHSVALNLMAIQGILRYYPEAGFRVVGYATPADGLLQVPADTWTNHGFGNCTLSGMMSFARLFCMTLKITAG